MLTWLERNRDIGFTVYELMAECDTTEYPTRKHLGDLVEEGIIKRYGANPTYYGFTGFDCDIKKGCPDVDEICMVFAHHCPRRERVLSDEETNDWV